MILTYTNIPFSYSDMRVFLFLKKVSLFPSRYESQVCNNSQEYQGFHEHNFVFKIVPKDHFFYGFHIMEAMLESQAALPSSSLK